MTLSEFFKQLDTFDHLVPITELVKLVRKVHLGSKELDPYRIFNPDCYQRNLMHRGPACQVFLICWLNGQRSPIHDHPGSSCAVRVIEGKVTETVFQKAPNGLIVPTVTREYEEGNICGSEDTDTHQISNLMEDGKNLVTMHVYTPPLLMMNCYSLTDSKVHEFVTSECVPVS